MTLRRSHSHGIGNKESHGFGSKWRARVYSKIKAPDLDWVNWAALVEQQLDNREVIFEFSRIQINNRKATSVRQSFGLRREIVQCIEQEDYESLNANLQKLSDIACNQSEKMLLEQFTHFFHLRRLIRDRNLGYWTTADLQLNSELLSVTKAKIGSSNSSACTCVKTKILSLLSLFILRVNGIFMSQDERALLWQTIQCKRRKIVQMDNGKDKTRQFESLLYIFSELYKVHFLLRKEQEIVLAMYNQLNAYLQLYKNRMAGYGAFNQKYKIEAALAKMQPILLNLNVYQDSEMRNRLIFKNMQREIVGQSGEISEGDTHNDNSAQKSVQSPFAEVEEGNKDQINIKGSDGKKDRVSVQPMKLKRRSAAHKICEKTKEKEQKSKKSRKTSLKLRIEDNVLTIVEKQCDLLPKSEQEYRKAGGKDKLGNQNRMRLSLSPSSQLLQAEYFSSKSLLQLSPREFRFQFVQSLCAQLLRGSFEANLTHSARKLNLLIRVWSVHGYVCVLRLNNIVNCAEPLQLNIFCRFLWRIFAFLLGDYSQLLVREVGNIESAQAYIPAEIEPEYELITLMRIHTSLTGFCRKCGLEQSLVGFRLSPIRVSSQQINSHFEEQEAGKKQRSVFVKRKAYLQSDPLYLRQEKSSEFLQMLMLVSVQEEYSCLRVCFEQHLKMIEIQDLGVRKHEYNKVISDRAHSLKLKKQDRPKGQFIKKVSEIMNDRGRDKAKQTGLQSSYHVEEELHIEEPRELAQLGKFVTLFDLKQQRKSKGRSRNKEEWITVRMSSGQYLLLKEQREEEYVSYANGSMKIYFPLGRQELPSCYYVRIRMYRIVVQLQHNQIVRYQLPKFSSTLTRMAQTLSIRLIKHQVVFGGRGYAIVLKYKCPCKNYLYEVVQARGKRKMAVTRTQLELATVQFNQQCGRLGELILQDYVKTTRQTLLSEAEDYYQRKGKQNQFSCDIRR